MEAKPLPTRKAVDIPMLEVQKEGSLKVPIAKLKPVENNTPLISTGVPFMRGQLESEEHIAFFDQQGNEIPIAIKVLARWPEDKSIRSVLVQFKYRINNIYEYVQ